MPWNRIGAISGILFVVLLIAGVVMAIGDTPDSSDPDADWVKYLNNDSQLIRNVIGGYLLVFSAIAFLVFLVVLARHLRQASAGEEILPTIAFVAGVAFVASLIAATGGLIAEPANLKLGDAPAPSVDFARNIQAVGFVILLIGGALSAAAMIAATSLIILRTHMLAAWIAILGFVASFALLFGAVFLPLIALPIWMLIVSVALLRRPEAAASA
ncbi:MAG TPA: hypothetical protein VFB90_02825 [Dehalococcoidia bacterium]|nr:hypothetical protein [Dehalococcoidia bacterium]